jgi:hypothetical protein
MGPRPALALLLVTGVIGPLLGACGYRMETPRLPNARHTIGVAPIVNRTFEAELDIRLQHELRERFFREAAIGVRDPERSDLVLTLRLDQLSYARARDITRGDVSSVSMSLSGVMTLRDAITGELILDRAPVSAGQSLELLQATVETPAVRDDALREVIRAFADAVVARLLTVY